MLKRKENKSNSKSQFFIIGSLLVLLGIGCIGGKHFYNYLSYKDEEIKIQEFFIEQAEINEEEIVEDTTTQEEQPKQETNNQSNINYVAVIKIPKIGLEKGLCDIGSYCNNVNRNIQIIKESTFPDVENGNFILAGHSGNGNVSYFRKLNKLSIDDEVSIFYQGKEYKYKVVNTYDVEKVGSVDIVRNAQKTTLTLITCRSNTNKQIVFICELQEVI